jgi:hypothetical protein
MLLQIFKKNLNSLIFNCTLKFLTILHQKHSSSLFYWNMNSVNTKSFPNYTRPIPSYIRQNPMARVNTICIPTPPRSSHITVGMHLLQDSCRTKYSGPNMISVLLPKFFIFLNDYISRTRQLFGKLFFCIRSHLGLQIT